MTFRQNTQLDVWYRMPPTKFLLGRKRVEQLVNRAVSKWPMAAFANCENKEEIEFAADAYAQRIAREEFGSIAVLLFIGLVTALVQVLLEWWLLKPAYRIEFVYWKDSLS